MRLEGSTESGERGAGRPDHPPCFKNQVCKILAQQQPRCPGEATGLINLERAIGGILGWLKPPPRMVLVLSTKTWAPRTWLPNPGCRRAAVPPSITTGNVRGDLFESCAFSRCCENHSISTRLRAFNKLRFCFETHRGYLCRKGLQKCCEREPPFIAIQTQRVKDRQKNCAAQ